jgi:hypothetical protein
VRITIKIYFLLKLVKVEGGPFVGAYLRKGPVSLYLYPDEERAR